VTFLFTDVEGSTRRWETDADAMRTALAAHDDVLLEAIGAHGGYRSEWSAPDPLTYRK
jgi:class 3 adenylate cyclase